MTSERKQEIIAWVNDKYVCHNETSLSVMKELLDGIDSVMKELDSVKVENKKFEKALKFYQQRQITLTSWDKFGNEIKIDMTNVFTQHADEALAKNHKQLCAKKGE